MPYPNYPNMPQYQPYAQAYTPVNNMQRQQGNIIGVNGIDGAKAFPMMPNTSVILLDNTEPYIYLKTTDAANFPTVERFKIEKDPIVESQVAEVTYATHSEIEALSSKIEKLAELFESKMTGDNNVQSNIQQPTTTASHAEPYYEQTRAIQSSDDRGYQGNIRPDAGQPSA